MLKDPSYDHLSAATLVNLCEMKDIATVLAPRSVCGTSQGKMAACVILCSIFKYLDLDPLRMNQETS